ncbi:HAD-IA family hydrolase [Streptomyces sp. TRM 70361]|uniref:HAD-IA family hydrolase n=1 Tax=Streptomyces sp. TRM 70361 TaxID=3116553 RepID=UPI002E7BC64C|nr:HAD-IA family hydrolase [Streptomyces sp. TRM 70361]MEE1938166.1 HAD-IA family hydrolase [Streptomyces sp. TRM 70361]
MRTRCVVLDIGGVLEITPATGWQQDRERRLGLPVGTVGRRLGEVWRAGSVGAIGEEEVRARVAAEPGLDASRVDALMADLWAEYLGNPNEELITCVRGLRSRCRLGVLSTSLVGARGREAEAYRFDGLVGEIVHSHEAGICKPDPAAYALVCARLEVCPEDCLFVDDVGANVDAAREAGMWGHLFEDNARTIDRIFARLGAAA